jgi:hypothetical protein
MWHEWRREMYTDNLLGRPTCGMNSSGSGQEQMARCYAQSNEFWAPLNKGSVLTYQLLNDHSQKSLVATVLMKEKLSLCLKPH